MARTRFRDRFYTPKVARAVTAPSTILLTGAAAAGGVVLSGAIGAALLPAILLGGVFGAAAYAGRVLLAVPRDPRGPRPDPFAVQEPWRRFVGDALAARQRFDEAVAATRPGPLRDSLSEIGARLDDGVQEIWRIAQQGDSLVAARSRVDADAARRELAQVEAQAAEPWAQGSRLQQTAEALRSQVATAERMEAVISDAHDRLRLLDARLDEAVSRAVELSVGTSSHSAGAVSSDVDGIVSEMEALRQALDEASAAGGGARPLPPTPGPAASP